MSYLTEPLTATHRKQDFHCGKLLLDDHLKKQAKQDVKRHLCACFILPGDNHEVKGYYTLSGAAIERQYLPSEIIKKMPPNYHDLPATLLGRLAVHEAYKGQGLGELLLMDALKRCHNVSVSDVGSMAVIADPLDEDATRFYTRYGFLLLPDSGKMFIAMKTVADLFS
jgi:GNAT superfamily N-acetyltransferase